jgi:hypothetical protein
MEAEPAEVSLNSDEALAFLAEHRRLPEDSPQETIDKLDAVRRHFEAHPDPRCIPLFMAVVDDHMGWGIFQLLDGVLERFPQAVLTPHLRDALAANSRGGRWWAAQWALAFPSPDLVPELSRLLQSPEDRDAHYFAIGALGEVCDLVADPAALRLLRERSQVEQDAETRALLAAILAKCDGPREAG